MLAHTQAIVKKLKEKLAKGAGNQPDEKTGQINQNKLNIVYCYQNIVNFVLAHFRRLYPTKDGLKNVIFLSSLFAEHFQCGNCYEHSAATIVDMIVAGIKAPLEIFYVFGFSSNGTWADHALPVINRNKNSAPNWVLDWNRECVIADVWANKIKSLETSPPEFGDLMGNYLSLLSPANTQLALRIENNFNANDWNDVVIFLETAKKIITRDFIKDFFNHWGVKLQPETEWFRMMVAINEKIEEYKKLAEQTILSSPSSQFSSPSSSPSQASLFSPSSLASSVQSLDEAKRNNTELVKAHTASKLKLQSGFKTT